ncbi:MAG: class I SAM-dependent methyltransferase [Clostridia bacterium]|nr:class I SAM-dependent methyltransferase [Clostridia bacterium]
MRYNEDFKDYELIDMANSEKLERWGDVYLIRPDPQIVWTEKSYPKLWNNAHARYIRSNTGGGMWQKLKPMKDVWSIKYKDLKFNLKLMGFKHTGLFPEQSVNWEYMINKIKMRKSQDKNSEIKVLNLFAYTGGATVACLSAGASVCHVDSSQGMVNWAKENVISSGLKDKPVRFIVDDVIKFVEREIRRGNFYDAIIMDPPSYGRGKNGEVWNIENDLYNLISLCSKILSQKPLFFIVNTYTGGLSGTIIQNVLRLGLNKHNFDSISSDEIGLKMSKNGIMLPCGITTIYEGN